MTMYKAAGNLDITDYLNSSGMNLDEQAGYAINRNAENAAEVARMAGEIFSAEPRLLVALAAGQAPAEQQNQEGNPFADLIPGLTNLAGNLFKGGGDVEVSGIGLGEDQASLVPGIDVRSDFDNRINPIEGFGGVMNA